MKPGRKKVMEKRKQYHFYATEEEYKTIVKLASRVGLTPSSTVRKCALGIAADPALEYIFDPGVLLKLDKNDIEMRSYIFRNIGLFIDEIKKQGIEIVQEDGDDHD